MRKIKMNGECKEEKEADKIILTWPSLEHGTLYF